MAANNSINLWPMIFREYPGQPELELECLRRQYVLLSHFHVPYTQHKMLQTIEPMMDYVLNRVQQLRLLLVTVDSSEANKYFDNLKNKTNQLNSVTEKTPTDEKQTS